jgi:hypothetical protein
MAHATSIIDENGVERVLGNLVPASAPTGDGWAVYGDLPKTPLFTRAQMLEVVKPKQPFSLRRYIARVTDQDGVGECNLATTVTCLEARRKQKGLRHYDLSAGYAYGFVNGGRDRGSMLEDSVKFMMEHGTCLESTVAFCDWHSRPRQAAEEAPRFRFMEAYWCPTFDHVASAILAGYFVNLGIMWYPNFKTDGDGWLPLTGRGVPGGHSICRAELHVRDDVKGPGGEPYMLGLGGPNNWTTGWGADGYMVIAESLCGGGVGGWWALGECVDEGGSVPGPAA